MLDAVYNNDTTTVDHMIKMHPRLCNGRHPTTGRTPLAFAAAYGNLEITRLLCSHGAALFVNDYYGIGPIHMAAMNGHHALIDFLLVDQGQIRGWFLVLGVSKVISNNNMSACMVTGANTRDYNGQTPLHHAVR